MRPTYQEIVDHFKRCVRPRRRDELAYYRSPSSLSDAISRAALSTDWRSTDDRVRRHSHQRRIPALVLRRVERELLAAVPFIRACTSFENLHELIALRLAPIRGAGELLVYDIAQRIGIFRKLEPEVVYLHAGTRQGAKELGIRGKVVSRRELAAEFRSLSPSELEDLFCNYKDALAGAALPESMTPCSAGPRERKRRFC